MVFPWQLEQWQQLWRAKQENRLPHALLFIGLKGTGKINFAENFIRAQFCRPFETAQTTRLLRANGLSMCDCHACRIIMGKSHPNVLWVEPEKEGSAIKVDQVRDITEFINQTSLQGEYRFVVINPASNMNINAANALLKTLEEPSSGSIMILLSEQASHLPATILSRCQHIHFPRPPKELALNWLSTKQTNNTIDTELALRLAHGAPLAAMQLVQDDVLSTRLELLQILFALSEKQGDPIKSAISIQDLDLLLILDFTLSLIIDLLRLHLGSETTEITNQDFTSQLKDLRQRTLLKNISQYMDYLHQLRCQIRKGMNLNKQLLLENVLIRWMECSHVSS